MAKQSIPMTRHGAARLVHTSANALQNTQAIAKPGQGQEDTGPTGES